MDPIYICKHKPQISVIFCSLKLQSLYWQIKLICLIIFSLEKDFVEVLLLCKLIEIAPIDFKKQMMPSVVIAEQLEYCQLSDLGFYQLKVEKGAELFPGLF